MLGEKISIDKQSSDSLMGGKTDIICSSRDTMECNCLNSEGEKGRGK